MRITPAAAAVIAAALYIAARPSSLAAAVSFLTKDGVVLNPAPQLEAVLPVIDRVSVETIGRRAIFTAGTDGTHKPGSLHYAGLAVDLRTRDLSAAQTDRYATALRNALNGQRHVFDVIREVDHIHVEYDPR